MTNGNSWFDAKVRRRLQITLYAVTAAAAILLTVVLVAAINFKTEFSLSDRLAAINDVLAGAALVLGLTAAGIALQSYASATGTPEIEVQVWFGGDPKNKLVVIGTPAADGLLRSVDVAGQACLHVRLRNVGGFDASQLIVSVQFDGVTFDQQFDTTTREWRIIDALDGLGATAAEWASHCTLHAKSARRLPDLEMRSLICDPNADSHAVCIFLACTNYRRQLYVPVQVLEEKPMGGIELDDAVQAPEWL